MSKRLLATLLLVFFIIQVNAQLGAMKLVGNGTEDYKMGFGAFIKTGFPVLEGSDLTLEIGADIFPLDDRYGTIMCPLKAGYRYTLNGTGKGFYVEPQVGFNVYGITSLQDKNGEEHAHWENTKNRQHRLCITESGTIPKPGPQARARRAGV